MIPSQIDVVDKGLGRLLSQFQGKPNIEALLGSLLGSVQTAEDKAFDVLNDSELPTAIGAQLDQLGKLFGVDRDGRDDDQYRAAIFARLSVLTTKSTVDSVLTVVKNICSPAHAVTRENFYTTIITDANKAYTNRPTPLSNPNYDPESNFAGGANVAYNATDEQWTKPVANVIVEITANGNDFSTIPTTTREAVQGAVAVGVKASTVMMKKDFYMKSLVEGFTSIKSEIIEVDTSSQTGLLAYNSPANPNNPVASGNIVAKFASDSGLALSTNQNRFREIRRQQPEPSIVHVEETGAALFIAAIPSEVILGESNIFVKKIKVGSEKIKPFDVVRGVVSLPINVAPGFTTEIVYSVITEVTELVLDGEEYFNLKLFSSLPQNYLSYVPVVYSSFDTLPSGWLSQSDYYTTMLVTTDDGQETLLLDYAGTGVESEDELENKIGILMEIQHD